MASKKPKGDYNRAPIFDGENYDYWKECMRIHIQSVDYNRAPIFSSYPYFENRASNFLGTALTIMMSNFTKKISNGLQELVSRLILPKVSISSRDQETQS